MSKAEDKLHRHTLMQIAMMGHGLKEEVRDWANIGRNAVMLARETLSEKCPKCGKKNEFKPRKEK